MSLINTMVVILGGSSGMGLATAKAAQAEGARVVITGRSPERLQAARAVLGDEVRTVALDKGFLYSEYCAAYETTYRRNERSDENHLLPSLLRQPSGGRRLPLFQRNNFGGSFGGPIKKDKTFFYGVYEALRQNLCVTILDNVLPAACHQLVNRGSNNRILKSKTSTL